MNIANNIDHTMLKADAGKNTILSYCKEAKENGFASVCVNTCYVKLVASELKESEVKTCCVVGFPLGADYVKTSTGFSTGGATIEDVKLMKETVGERLKVKASGGIRTREFAEELMRAGADRIGAGNGMMLL